MDGTVGPQCGTDMQLAHERLLLPWRPRAGDHCETTMMVNLLAARGIDISEPMMFGLGEGIDFRYWQSPCITSTPPMITGRTHTLSIARAASTALNTSLHEVQSATPTDGHVELSRRVGRSTPAGVTVDIYHLDHFASRTHFSAHCLTVCALNDDVAWVVDTQQQGGLQPVSIKSLKTARASTEGFEPSPHKVLFLTVDPPLSSPDMVTDRAWRAAHRTARRMLEGRERDGGLFGMQLMAKLWGSRPMDWPMIGSHAFEIGRFWRYAGTGGANFRAMFYAFLTELADRSVSRRLERILPQFNVIRARWDELIDALMDTRDSLDPVSATALLAEGIADLAALEERAFQALHDATLSGPLGLDRHHILGLHTPHSVAMACESDKDHLTHVTYEGTVGSLSDGNFPFPLEDLSAMLRDDNLQQEILLIDPRDDSDGSLAAALRDAVLTLWVSDTPPRNQESEHVESSARHRLTRYRSFTATCLPFSDDQFTAVICLEPLTESANPACMIAEVSRILRPGGCFLFMGSSQHFTSVCNGDPPLETTTTRFSPDNSPLVTMLTLDDNAWRATLTASSLGVATIREHSQSCTVFGRKTENLHC
ncbi:hypothetical protein HMPREF1531_00810 [Propionibacterium sp. oral taxon 192 str. F0372]|mgnify:CR=1 FL=1|nr:hypothetical protein HMPREF1531_00810 [Propionibacterium sp. oral taxon 192 str. F0372]